MCRRSVSRIWCLVSLRTTVPKITSAAIARAEATSREIRVLHVSLSSAKTPARQFFKCNVYAASNTLHLKNWRAGVFAEDKETWRTLISRLVASALAIAALVIFGTVVRRLTRHHMRDTERRHIALVIQRIVL